MTKIERVLIDYVKEHRKPLFLIIMTFIGFFIRFAGRDFVSPDMRYFLLPWYEEIQQNGGINGLGTQVGNYNILYQTLIALMNYINIDPVYQYKALSCIFDFGIAFLLLKIVNEKVIDMKGIAVFSFAMIIPEFFLNSSIWGQCDAIYVFFCILFLYLLRKELWAYAFIALGAAFSFKFQTIFFLPFIIIIYITQKKFSILNFAYTILAFWASGIVGYIKGRNILEPFKIYFSQTKTDINMVKNSNSIWVLIGDDYNALSKGAILITIAIFGVMLYWLIENNCTMDSKEKYYSLAAWTLLTCYIFLPCMHERYSYPADVLLLLVAVINPRYSFVFIYSSILSTITYGMYLFNNGAVSKAGIIVYVFVYLIFTKKVIDNKDGLGFSFIK
ncbi:Mannosyltransferase related to Gpi18 [Pseudobutyrivibrio sp. 49]|uniref:hypothetical protein n=1 Tax=Pseudobutyrivibrio sp. 49 TaxID=1855344 RepID=UPI00088F6B50|nr:hypothetical protein [Pseudobutyrivibrio sp. 49]SDH59503.1 Mannosyltransferase related to Gpi18 [Pseudobutyrivibrio sp. 49]